jgi:hypothetical protein
MDAVMDIISLRSETDSIGKLEIVSQTTSEDAGAAMKILGDFNGNDILMMNFCKFWKAK